MAPLARWIRSLGNAGAVANAQRACTERRLADQRVDSLTARLASAPRPAA